MLPDHDPGQLSKQVIFRIREDLKIDLRVALLKNKIDIQNTFTAFAEIFVAIDRGEKIPDVIKAIIKRSHFLAGE